MKQSPRRPGIAPAPGLRRDRWPIRGIADRIRRGDPDHVTPLPDSDCLRGASCPTPIGRHPAHRRAASRHGLRPTLERLEDLTLLTSYTAATVSDLIADISASNQQGGTNSIALVAGNPFQLTAVDNTTDGATGLPVIAANDNLTIVGNGDAIARSTTTGTPAFRLLDVAAGASLTLQDLTLQGGLASGAGVAAEGGAIYSQGTLNLNGVTVQNNEALGNAGRNAHQGKGGNGGNGLGGGLYVAGGSVTLTGVTVTANTAEGGQGGHGGYSGSIKGSGGPGGNGGNGSGGGLYVAGGSVTLTGSTLSANTAQGGQGGRGGGRFHGGTGGLGGGGGLYAAGGTVALNQDTVTRNAAQGGAGGAGVHSGSPGLGEGGGLFIDSAAVVSLDAFTQANVTNNTASTKDPNIHGPWRHS